MPPASAPGCKVLDLVPWIDTVVDSVDMPTEAEFNNRKKRVTAPKRTDNAERTSWVQKHPTWAWALPTVIAIVAVVVAVFGVLLPHLENDADLRIRSQVTESLKEPSQKIERMSDDIAEIKGTLKAWAPFMTAQFFKRAASLPDKQFMESLPQLKAVAQVARETKSEVAPTDIAEIGKRTIALAAGHSDSSALAWDTTTTLLQYRSALNAAVTSSRFVGVPEQHPVPTDVTEFGLGQYSFIPVTSNQSEYPNDYVNKPYTVTLGPLVPGDNAAISELIGKPNAQKGLLGAKYIVFDANVHFILDGLHLRHVVFRNGTIVYRGGPLILEDVYFVNCTFSIQSTPVGRSLGNAILASEAVTFKDAASPMAKLQLHSRAPLQVPAALY